MIKKLLLLALVISLPLIWIACSEDNMETPRTTTVQSSSQGELFDFLDAFEEEAEFRGNTLPLTGFQMTFVSDLGEFCGYGWWDYDGFGTRRVEISTSENCWPSYDEDQKEQLMYHEFGHALLSRPHLDSKLPNGQPISMMCGDCDQTRIYYHPQMKKYYLDELFDTNTDLPDWVTNENYVQTSYEEDFESDTHEWENFIYGDDDNQSGWEVLADQDGADNQALRVRTSSPAIAGSSIIVLDRFDISDFPDCSALKATVTLKYDLPLEADLTFGLSLREREGETLTRFFYHPREYRASSNLAGQTLTTEIYCLPEKTDVVTVSVTIETRDQVDLLVDDVVVELWN